MGKGFAALAALTLLFMLMAAEQPPALGDGAPSDQEALESAEILVPEDAYLSMLTELSINRAQYLGRTVRITGMFDQIDYAGGETVYRVFRYSCEDCGLDAQAHMDIAWDGPWPERWAWVEAVGALEEYEMFGERYLRLHLTELNPAEPGLQFIVN
jgi:hypothetical protein